MFGKIILTIEFQCLNANRLLNPRDRNSIVQYILPFNLRSGIPDLKQQTVNSITLTACDTGDIDYMHSRRKDNAAAQFMERMNVNYVIAPDARNFTDSNNANYFTIETYVPLKKDEKGDYKIKSTINEGYLMYYGNRSICGYYSYVSLGNGPYQMKELLELGNKAYMGVSK